MIKLSARTAIYPGVAKFGIALEWGSRGLEFESQHSDQNLYLERDTGFLFVQTEANEKPPAARSADAI